MTSEAGHHHAVTWVVDQGIEVPADVTITLELHDNAMSGFAGCNRFRMALHVDGERATPAGPILATRKAGPFEAMAAEAELLARLERLASIHHLPGRIELRDADGELLVGGHGDG